MTWWHWALSIPLQLFDTFYTTSHLTNFTCHIKANCQLFSKYICHIKTGHIFLSTWPNKNCCTKLANALFLDRALIYITCKKKYYWFIQRATKTFERLHAKFSIKSLRALPWTIHKNKGFDRPLSPHIWFLDLTIIIIEFPLLVLCKKI